MKSDDRFPPFLFLVEHDSFFSPSLLAVYLAPLLVESDATVLLSSFSK